MLQAVFVVFKRSSSIIWWVNIDTLNLPCKLLLQRFQRQQIIPMYQYVIENVMLTHPVRRMVRLLRVFDENPWLQPWPVVFPNPGEFEFRVLTQRCVLLAWLIRRRLLRIRLTLPFSCLLLPIPNLLLWRFQPTPRQELGRLCTKNDSLYGVLVQGTTLHQKDIEIIYCVAVDSSKQDPMGLCVVCIMRGEKSVLLCFCFSISSPLSTTTRS